MSKTDWTQKYKSKVVDASQAIKKIKRGARIFLGTGCGVPYHLVQELAAHAGQMADNEIVHLLTLGDPPSADQKFQNQFRHNTFFVSAYFRKAVSEGRADYTPIMLSDIPDLFRHKRMPLDIAMIQISPPDRNGYGSLGISVDITKSASESADISRCLPVNISHNPINSTPTKVANHTQKKFQRLTSESKYLIPRNIRIIPIHKKPIFLIAKFLSGAHKIATTE